MGEQFLRAKSEVAKRLREEAFEQEMATESLFSASPGTFITVYRCQCIRDDIALNLGDPLLILDDGGKTLSVLRHNSKIGYVIEDDSEELRQSLAADGRLPGICFARVSEPVSLDRTFTVAIIPVGGGD